LGAGGVWEMEVGNRGESLEEEVAGERGGEEREKKDEVGDDEIHFPFWCELREKYRFMRECFGCRGQERMGAGLWAVELI